MIVDLELERLRRENERLRGSVASVRRVAGRLAKVALERGTPEAMRAALKVIADSADLSALVEGEAHGASESGNG